MRLHLFAAAFVLVACAPATETTPAPVPATKTVRPTIATLQTHDKRVSILSGSADGELRVMVRNNEGTIIADGITVDELSRTDPMLGVLINHAVAKNTYLDATLDLPHRH